GRPAGPRAGLLVPLLRVLRPLAQPAGGFRQRGRGAAPGNGAAPPAPALERARTADRAADGGRGHRVVSRRVVAAARGGGRGCGARARGLAAGGWLVARTAARGGGAPL